MHFSIPDTQELNEGNGSTFIGYNIHINGVFHCTMRYKQLHNLNEQLKMTFGADQVPFFPPKKLLPLTLGQLDERRILLEKYIQTVGQDGQLMSSQLICGFLLSAQQETACKEQQDVHLDIYTMNNYPIKVRVSTYDGAEKVLHKTLKHVNLATEYMHYFSLYLVKTENTGETIVLRKVFHFESPYMTQIAIRGASKLVIRKNYWDKKYDMELMKDPVALNLLYIQTVADVEKGWLLTTNESKLHLDLLKSKLDKKEYIEYAQHLKYYGFMQFVPCYCNFPQAQTRVLVAIGDGELSLRILGPGSSVKEGVFKVTRMRCWRIISTSNKMTNHLENSTCGNSAASSLELSFEYLMAKDKLQWITISSDQAILMSVCLQSLVDELLVKRHGLKTQPCAKQNGKLTYMKRDGSYQYICVDDYFPDYSDNQENNGVNSSQEPFSIKTLQETFSSVSFKNGREIIENQAFEGIGDDDL